jgi:hypothetical protein
MQALAPAMNEQEIQALILQTITDLFTPNTPPIDSAPEPTDAQEQPPTGQMPPANVPPQGMGTQMGPQPQ